MLGQIGGVTVSRAPCLQPLPGLEWQSNCFAGRKPQIPPTHPHQLHLKRWQTTDLGGLFHPPQSPTMNAEGGRAPCLCTSPSDLRAPRKECLPHPHCSLPLPPHCPMGYKPAERSGRQRAEMPLTKNSKKMLLSIYWYSNMTAPDFFRCTV